MEAAKPWYQSRTVLLLLAAILIGIAKYFGISIGDTNKESLADFLLQYIPIVLAVISRFSSTKQVTLTPTAAREINYTAGVSNIR